MTVQEEVRQRIERDALLAKLRGKIGSGKATYADTAAYSNRAGKLLGEIFSRRLPEIPLSDREALCAELLHDRYTDINTLCDAVQEALDKAQGLHLRPQHALFDTKRAHQIGGSTADTSKPEEVRQRRARAATETMTKAMHDDRIKAEAKFRSRAGLKCYINRVSVGGCCKWCQEVSGRYLYDDAPKGIFRRHDNCDCTVVYDTQRGTRQVLRGTTKKWEVVAEGAGAPEPIRLTAEQAKRLQAKKGLTNLSENGTIKEERFRIGKPVPFTEKSYEMMLNKQSYVAAIVQKYNIHLRGSGRKISIVIDYTIPAAGKSCEIEPDIIRLGQAAFYDEIQLANTIAHELNHCRSWLKGGNAPEGLAYHAGDTLESFIRGEL